MIDSLDYTVVEGENATHAITVYALSTCGFCKRALQFLDTHKIPYRYIYMDKISMEKKNEVKGTLKAQHKVDVAFPFTVIDEKQVLVGFIEPDWKKTLGLE